MRIDPIGLNHQSKLMNDYRLDNPNITSFFDYQLHDELLYENRLQDLRERTFDRTSLVNALMEMNEQWNAPTPTLTNIGRLRDETSVVVIGGQQAGLLTGPMYTINKLISVIQLAREQEKQLNRPVIPVFWIAGEDHDVDEMNHIYLPEATKMKKHTLAQKMPEKMSVSEIEKDDCKAREWINQLFAELQETSYTKELYQTIHDCLDRSTTYVDFFARVLFSLFTEEGIVLADAQHPLMRRLESDHFLAMIDQQAAITSGVYQNEQRLNQLGYANSLEVEQDDAHLFYYDGARILLSRQETGEWVGKQNEVKLTTDDLRQIAVEQPERLSNNVVTRPLMQECLFPTLAFIGGPGEIGYWAALKPAFHALSMKMPPAIPRLSFTFIEPGIHKLLDKYGADVHKTVNDGIANERGNWLAAQSNPPLEQITNQLKRTVEDAHQPLQTVARQIQTDLGELAEKNLSYLLSEIDYVERRLVKQLEKKYAKTVDEFASIQLALHPNEGLQERMWNPLPWFNAYGADFIKKLVDMPCSFTNPHYVVYM